VALEHPKLRRCGEDGRHTHEVSATEPLLGLRPDSRELAIRIDETLGEEVFEDGLGAAVEGWQAVPGVQRQASADRLLLQAQRHQLLRDDVPRLGRSRPSPTAGAALPPRARTSCRVPGTGSSAKIPRAGRSVRDAAGTTPRCAAH
jgi:hypothetical protein